LSIVSVEHLVVKFPIYKSRPDSGLMAKLLGRSKTKSSFDVLSDVSFELNDGDRVALIGKNGAGKSTLLQVIAGLLPPSQGKVVTNGQIFPFLTPTPGLLVNATCMQNIILQGLSYGFKGDDLRSYIDTVSAASDLGDFVNSPVSTLSAGMRSRFSISTLCGVEPELLFLDEWIGAADQKVLGQEKGLLASLVDQSKIFVIASHRSDVILSYCNKAIVLEEGKIVHFGDVEAGLKLVR